MRIAFIYYAVYWLNIVPKAENYSPRDLILGKRKLDYKVICKLSFGAYVLVHDGFEKTNTMETRTTGGINLGQLAIYKELIMF